MDKPAPTIDRRELLAQIITAPENYLIVTGLAGAARDTAALTGDGDNLFTMAGCMGAAVSTGLGIALSAPARQTLVVTGDGEMLMNLGSLASVATMAPDNMTIVCIDNGCHGETGGQTGHTSNRTDLEMIARGAGIASTMTLVDPSEIPDAKAFLMEAPAPRFLLCRVMDGPPAVYKRNMDPAECRLRFRTHVQNTA